MSFGDHNLPDPLNVTQESKEWTSAHILKRGVYFRNLSSLAISGPLPTF